MLMLSTSVNVVEKNGTEEMVWDLFEGIYSGLFFTLSEVARMRTGFRDGVMLRDRDRIKISIR